eukprot:scaffold327020_cov24-Attheya_sp.AAC.1
MESESPPRSVDSQREFQRSILLLDRHRTARRVADEAIAAGAFAPEGNMTMVDPMESDDEPSFRRRSSRGASIASAPRQSYGTDGLTRGELPWDPAPEAGEDSETGSRRSRASDAGEITGTRQGRTSELEEAAPVRSSKRSTKRARKP